jgi:hypothetical protein
VVTGWVVGGTAGAAVGGAATGVGGTKGMKGNDGVDPGALAPVCGCGGAGGWTVTTPPTRLVTETDPG